MREHFEHFLRVPGNSTGSVISVAIRYANVVSRRLRLNIGVWGIKGLIVFAVCGVNVFGVCVNSLVSEIAQE